MFKRREPIIHWRGEMCGSESTASHVMCINTLEGGKGFISSAVTCIIRQQHYPHGETACRAVGRLRPSLYLCVSRLENVEMNSNSLSLFFSPLWCECVWVRDGTAFTHLSNSNLLCYFYFYFFFLSLFRLYVVGNVLEFSLLEFSCCCFLSFRLWWWGWKD